MNASVVRCGWECQKVDYNNSGRELMVKVSLRALYWVLDLPYDNRLSR